MNITRAVLMDFLHLFILVGFAFAQPVFDLLGQNSEFFVSHKASSGPIFVLVFVLSIGVALGFVLLELLMALIGERIRRGLHWVVITQYLQQVGYVDWFLGMLLKKLETAELYHEALIILTADHGVSFQRGLSRQEIEKGNKRNILKVPMFVKLPWQREGKIIERLVSGIDILPTIVDVLGVKTFLGNGRVFHG
jgi:membrane-anchored protein YejM (alkaline phosphatase superfamily)